MKKYWMYSIFLGREICHLRQTSVPHIGTYLEPGIFFSRCYSLISPIKVAKTRSLRLSHNARIRLRNEDGKVADVD